MVRVWRDVKVCQHGGGANGFLPTAGVRQVRGNAAPYPTASGGDVAFGCLDLDDPDRLAFVDLQIVEVLLGDLVAVVVVVHCSYRLAACLSFVKGFS